MPRAPRCPPGLGSSDHRGREWHLRGEEITERHGATYVHLDKGNVAQARNRGVEQAGQVDAVAFLDDDVVPHAGWLERIVAPILAGDADATIGGIHVVTDSDIDPRFHAYYVDTAYALDPEQPFLAGLNMAVRPDAFQAVGGFICECAPRDSNPKPAETFLSKARTRKKSDYSW